MAGFDEMSIDLWIDRPCHGGGSRSITEIVLDVPYRADTLGTGEIGPIFGERPRR